MDIQETKPVQILLAPTTIEDNELVMARTTIEGEELVIRISLNKETLPRVSHYVPMAKAIITENSLIVRVGNLVPIDAPGAYTVNLGDIVKIVYGYPIYPKSTIKNIKVVISNGDSASLISVLQIPPEKVLGSGAIGAFITVKKASTIKIDVVPIDIEDKEIPERAMHIDLTIKGDPIKGDPIVKSPS